MLRLLQQPEMALTRFCEKDVFGTRVAALMDAYGTAYPFALFYLQENETEVAAAVCKIDGAVTLCCGEEADYDEIAEFVSAVGFESILCSAEACKKLSLTPKKTGFTVEYMGRIETGMNMDVCYANRVELSDIYGILKGAGFDGLGSLHQWLAAVSIRVRRGTAQAAAYKEFGKPVSCAMVLFSTQKAALIGAVATLPLYRGKGYAGALVTSLARAEKAKNKRVELLCAKNGIIGFYNKLGFEISGEWAAV